MPTGRVHWFDTAEDYGFIINEGDKDVFLPVQALPIGVTMLCKGAKMEYSAVDGCRGPQATDVRLIASAPSLVKTARSKADDMTAICEDLIKMLDAADNTLRRHRHPPAADNKELAMLLRVVAGQFDVQD